jgi:hypothetical protein
MPETKGSLLRFSIAYALSSVKLHLGRRFVALKLTEEQRYAIAEQTIEQMRKFGEWKELDDEAKPQWPAADISQRR